MEAQLKTRVQKIDWQRWIGSIVFLIMALFGMYGLSNYVLEAMV